MVGIDNLFEKIKQHNVTCDIDVIKKAYDFAFAAHDGQKRYSGEPYIIHPLEVAIILAELELDQETIVAGLLHDIIEDTEYDFEYIKKEFGEPVATLVQAVTKLGKIPHSNKQEQQVENFRKMFFAMAKDIRVILIKLADRLHNMRTLKSMREAKQRDISHETMEVYAPIAHRLGISKIKWELEDLSLRYLDPVGYYEIGEGIAQKRQERVEFIDEVKKNISTELESLGIKGFVDGRAKHFYSIYRKMYSQNKTIDQIFDLFAVRVIVDSVSDCYSVLGMVHVMYKPIPGRFKDYIATPKPNFYQSLHTTLIGKNGSLFELQIRTWDMHRIAEYGIAAHWKYKEGDTTLNDSDAKLAWVRQLMESQKDTDAESFMSAIKIDLFSDEVFVFTPKGEVINLPNGATPIDFAFAIHTAVGSRMMGAKVNGKITTLDYTLKNGDFVEIITSSSVHGPGKDWLKIAKTSQARNKINQWFKKENREENIASGKDMLEKELKKVGHTFSELFKSEYVDIILKRYSFGNIDDMYASIGFGGITASKIIMRLKDEYKKQHDEKEIIITPEQKQGNRKNNSVGVIVKGIDNCLVRFSKCCTPVPGDKIVGYITRGRGVSVHRCDCVNVLNFDNTSEGERIIDVAWAMASNASYVTDVKLTATDRSALLSEVSGILADFKIPVRSLNVRTTKDRVAIFNIAIEISDTAQLDRVLKRLSFIQGILAIERGVN